MEHELAEREQLPTSADLTPDAEQEIATLDEAISLLTGCLDEIRASGTVSKPQMTAIVETDASVLPDHVPINSFTQEPSATNVEVAMEGLAGSIGRTLIRAIQAVWAFIKRIYNYIADFVKETYQRYYGVKRQHQQVRALSWGIEQAEAMGIKGGDVHLPPSAVKELERIDKRRVDIVQQYERGFSKLTHALVNPDKTIVEVRKRILTLPGQVSRVTSAIDDLKARERAGAFALTDIRYVGTSQWDDDQKHNTALSDKLRLLSAGGKVDATPFTTLLAQLNEPSGAAFGTQMLLNYTTMVEQTRKLDSAMRQMPRFERMVHDEQQGNELRDCMETLRSYSASIQSLIGITQQIETEQGNLIKLANQYQALGYEAMELRAKHSGAEMRKTFGRIHQDVRAKLKR